MNFRELLQHAVQGISPLSLVQVEQLEQHHLLLLRWNRRLNLTSIQRPEEIVVRHYGESLFLGTKLPFKPISIIDIGSGGGFPGIPLAVLRPDCSITLVESHQRRAVFLREATRTYSNVKVVAQRAETVSEKFDWMVSRAVKWSKLPRLGTSVALLIGEDDAEVAEIEGVVWRERFPLPGSKHRILLLGS